jgi:hypothetical protein
MYRIGAGCLGRFDDLGHVEVTLCRGRSTDVVGFVCPLYVYRPDIFVRIDGYRLYAKLFASANYSQGYFASVRDQNA